MAFTFQGDPVSVGEVLCAAHFRGELSAGAAKLAFRDACAAEAERLGLQPDNEAIGTMVEQFRYERDLISAEETEAWLGLRGLTAEDLEKHMARRHWEEALGAKMTAEETVPPVTAIFLGPLAADMMFDDGFRPPAVALSRRLVAGIGARRPDDNQVDAERRRFLARAGLDPARLDGWLAALERHSAWLEGMLVLEGTYVAAAAALLTPARLAGELAALRLPLTRLDLECVEFESLEAAREGHLCVREDGLSLEQVAEEARYPFRRYALLAEQAPEDLRQRLLCASVGEVLPPAPVGGVFHLLRLTGKVEPGLADPAVRERLEQRILDAHFGETAAGELRWRIT